MKPVWHILLLFSLFSTLNIHAWYIDSLDTIIEQRIKSILDETALDVITIFQQVNDLIANQDSLQDVYDLLQSKKFISFFLLDTSINMKDIKFALGAKIYLYCLDCCEKKMLHKSLKNYDSLDYWEHELFYENRDWLHKNITRWGNTKNYKKKIQQNIIHLESISKQTTYFLGLIRHNKQILFESFNKDVFEKHLMMAVRLQNIYLNDFQDCDYEVCEIYSILTATIQQFFHFSADLSVQYIECQPSQNFERNFTVYASIASGLCACAVAYYVYKDEVDVFSNSAYNIGLNLWDDKVKEPVKKIFNTLSGTKNEPLLDTAREEEILYKLYEQGDLASDPRDHNISLGQVIVDDGAQIVTDVVIRATEKIDIWSWFGYEKPVVEQKSIVLQHGQQGHQNMFASQQKELRCRVDQKDAVILSHAHKNAGDILPAMLRSGFNFGVNVQNVINDLHEEHRLTLGLAALLPAIVVVAGTVSATKKAYYSASYQSIRRIIRDLEMLLNDSIVKPISFDRDGKLYFLTELLKSKCNILTLKESKIMEDDIAELQSKNLTYLQKFNTVQRMYHTYACLLP